MASVGEHDDTQVVGRRHGQFVQSIGWRSAVSVAEGGEHGPAPRPFELPRCPLQRMAQRHPIERIAQMYPPPVVPAGISGGAQEHREEHSAEMSHGTPPGSRRAIRRQTASRAVRFTLLDEHPRKAHDRARRGRLVGPNATTLLQAWSRGDRAAAEQLFPLIYGELRRRAAAHLRGARRLRTLQPTALVHEVYLRLLEQQTTWQSRAHFLAISSQLMRRVLVDHARRAGRAKRFGGIRVTFDEQLACGDTPGLVDCLALDEALTRLAAIDDRKARIAELRFFGGLSIPETAHVLRTSTATIEREWRTARAWLYAALRLGETA
jgi:RNA polymerase sigma factor (TIGR02999 family)